MTSSFAFPLWLRQRAARAAWPGNLSRLITRITENGGDRIRTCDLEVMSLASYLAAPPRVIWWPAARFVWPGLLLLAYRGPMGKVQPFNRPISLPLFQIHLPLCYQAHS